tara:strand:- start:692 stop:814 length:123 start_codon:yes stop_codon:yes gene_type:complete
MEVMEVVVGVLLFGLGWLMAALFSAREAIIAFFNESDTEE